jgi:hypothetical protein
MRPLIPCALCAVGSVVLQCVAHAAGLFVLFTCASPFHALSCLLLLAFLHPNMAAMLARQAELVQLAAKAGRRLNVADVMNDPVLTASRPAPPPPWLQTSVGLGLIMVGDLSSALHIATSRTSWAVVRELGFGGAALALLYGTFTDAASALPPSRVLRAATWVVGSCIAASLILDDALLGGAQTALVYDDPLPTAAALRILACASFAARSGQALLGCMSISARIAVSKGSVPKHAADQLRHGLQLAGALLLLGPWALPLLLPGRHEALAIACDRLATVAITMSACECCRVVRTLCIGDTALAAHRLTAAVTDAAGLVCAPPPSRAFEEDPPVDGAPSGSGLH